MGVKTASLVSKVHAAYKEAENLTDNDIEVEYAEAESRKERLTGILKGIDALLPLTAWEKESKEFELRRNQLIGDSLLFAFYLVICGDLASAGRTVTLGQARSI
jgi:hypothetical protein